MDTAPNTLRMRQRGVRPGKPDSGQEFDWDMASKTTRGKDGEAAEEESDTEDPIQERRVYLQEEGRVLRRHLDTYLGRAEQLLQGNKRLEKEAQDTQEQSYSYESCGAKLGQDPPDMVITLNEQNRRDLAQVQVQKEELIPRYESKEQEVRSALKDTEAEASLLDTQLKELEPYKEQKVQAEQKVKALEKELRVTRIRCAEETHAIRSRFLQDKAECEQQFQRRMQELTWGAEEVALRALIQHVEQVKAENRLLRQELLGRLQHCQLLKEAKTQLQDQQEQLLREQQCARQAAELTPAQLALLTRQDGTLTPNPPPETRSS